MHVWCQHGCEHPPYAGMAISGLLMVQIPYTHKLVDPQNKPEDFKALYASIVANTDDSAKVPVIVGVHPMSPVML